MTPKSPVFDQHWREFTEEYPEMITRCRCVHEAEQAEPALSVDLVAFLHLVHWAKRKGYGPTGVSGLIPWVQQTYGMGQGR
jgi:hypothetical protein